MFKEKLEQLLQERLKVTKKIADLNKKIEKTEQVIVIWEEAITSKFHEDVDSSLPEYSNAEKRKAALKQALGKHRELQARKIELIDLSDSYSKIECLDKQLKIQEKYLFKEIDLHLAEL